jgi:hypothetical protein
MVLLFNIAHNKCLRINKPGQWDSCGLAECNVADPAQDFTFNANGSITNTSSTTCLVVTRQNDSSLAAYNPTDLRALPCNQGEGNGHSHYFTATKSDGSNIPVEKEDGPFMLRADYYRPNWALFAENNSLVKSADVGGIKDDRALWLLWEQKQKCDALGVSPNQCTKDKFSDCSNPENVKKWLVCPMAYCESGNNIGQEYCQTFCATAGPENKAKCDVAFRKFCAAHPDNVNECGCFNLQAYEPYNQALQAKGALLLPPCHIKQCAMNEQAWKTKEMQDQKNNCPNVQLCMPQINIKDNQNTKIEFAGNVSQKCDITNETNQQTNNAKSDPSTGQKELNNMFGEGTSQILMYAVPLLIIICLLCLSSSAAMTASSSV